MEYDVAVIGGGPAGCTVSTLLVQKGYTVVLMEKDKHPRFHIGESLLPRNMPILRKIGVYESVENIGVVKRGADFNAPFENDYAVFDFSDAMDNTEPTAFQVRREEFDEILWNNAAQTGADCFDETIVKTVDFHDHAVELEAESKKNGELKRIRANFVIDASGRETFLSSRLNLKERNPNHSSAAVFGHFQNVPRRTGDECGNISIYWFEHGWFWLIPLRDGRTSVGMVCWPYYLKSRNEPLEAFFWKAVGLQPQLHQRLNKAALIGDMTATGNFSYTSKAIFGDRYLLVGDAYAFIDPVFSSGVYLAMSGAEFAAVAVDGCLTTPTLSKKHLRRYQTHVTIGIKRFSWFIYRFTSPAIQFLFMNSSDKWGIKSSVISILAGDVYRPLPKRLPIVLFKIFYYALSLRRRQGSQVFHDRLKKG